MQKRQGDVGTSDKDVGTSDKDHYTTSGQWNQHTGTSLASLKRDLQKRPV